MFLGNHVLVDMVESLGGIAEPSNGVVGLPDSRHGTVETTLEIKVVEARMSWWSVWKALGERVESLESLKKLADSQGVRFAKGAHVLNLIIMAEFREHGRLEAGVSNIESCNCFCGSLCSFRFEGIFGDSAVRKEHSEVGVEFGSSGPGKEDSSSVDALGKLEEVKMVEIFW